MILAPYTQFKLSFDNLVWNTFIVDETGITQTNLNRNLSFVHINESNIGCHNSKCMINRTVGHITSNNIIQPQILLKKSEKNKENSLEFRPWG